MIEIIKRGTRRVIVCGVCGCKFAFDGEDIYHLEKHLFFSGSFQKVSGYKEGCEVYVRCPQCASQIEVKNTVEYRNDLMWGKQQKEAEKDYELKGDEE